MPLDTSPLATGGAGVDFETEVGAIYLAALLCGAPARGATGGRVLEVHFQQPHSEAPLDDMVVETEGTTEHARLDLQLKRTFAFRDGDSDFVSVLEACWATFQKAEFQSPAARFGVAIENFPAKVKEHYARVPEWARTSTSAEDFFKRIETRGFASKPMREFVTRIRSHLRRHGGEGASQDALWQFFARLVVIDFDVGRETSRDRHAAVVLLRSAVAGGDARAAQDLYDLLGRLVRKAARTGGGFTAETLRSRLLETGVALEAPPSIQADARRLTEHSTRIFDDINSSIGGLTLDRGSTASEVLASVDRGAAVVLTGPGGTGKSAILKTMGAVRRQDGFVLALSSERLRGVVGWEGLSARIGLECAPEELALGLSGSGRPCLLIDGAGRIDEEGARAAVNDILRAIRRVPSAPDETPRWSVVVTARTQALETVLRWIDLPREMIVVLPVPELEQVELDAICQHLPHLRGVLTKPEVGSIVRNLYFLRVLEEARERDPTLRVASPISEADVHRIWWEHLVGDEGARGRGRQAAMRRLGEGALASQARRLIADDIDPDVLHQLERDGILGRECGSDTYWFGHDILEEWTVARVLAQRAHGILDYLRSVGEPFWAFRALQFFACSVLEGENGADHWRELLSELENDAAADPRWNEAVLTAPLRSARIGALLPEIGGVLLADDGFRLKGLLRAMRTQAIIPNPIVERLQLDELSVSVEERASFALELAWPDLSVWMPVLRWLLPKVDGLPGALRGEVSHLMRIWQRSTPPGFAFRREIAEIAWKWRPPLVDPSGRRVIIARDAEPHFDRLRDVLALSADTVPELIPEFLEYLKEAETDHELAQWIARSPQPSLAQHTPAAYVDFVLDVVAPGWQDQDADPSVRVRQGVRSRDHMAPFESVRALSDHAFLSPSHLRGPFLFLLNADERQGLRLVHTLVNRSTNLWMDGEASDGREARLVLQFDEGPQEFRGYAQVYVWFRPMGGAPYATACALMALEVWMEQQMETGRDPAELFRTVVEGSTSAAVVGVCVAIVLAYPEKCLRVAVPFVASSLVWEYDIARYTMDRSGTFSSSGLFGPDVAERAALKRDERPQRGREIRGLVWRYLFERGLEDLRERVVEAIRGFPDDLTLLSDEERADPEAVAAHRRSMENFVPWADPGNYTFYKNPDGSLAGVKYEAPAELQERNAAQRERLERTGRYWRLQAWASKALEQGAPPEDLSVPEAVEMAKELQRPHDFTRPLERDGDNDHYRLRAIVGVAEAAVRAVPDSLERDGRLDWCRHVLLAAAQTPAPEDLLHQRFLGERVALMAARGLMGLVQLGEADQRCRLAVFGLLRGPSTVADAVMDGVRGAWDADPILCRNAVARELAFAVEPRREYGWHVREREAEEAEAKAWAQEIERRFEENLREGRAPESIGIERPRDDDYVRPARVKRALCSVPRGRLADGSEIGWALQVTDAVLGRAIEEATRSDGARRRLRTDLGYEWLAFLGDWLAFLAGLLPAEDVERHVMEPLRGSWPQTAGITTEFLCGFTRRHLAQPDIPEAISHLWSEAAEWVIPSEPLSTDPEWLPQDEQEALGLMMHVRYGRSLLTEVWEGAPAFVDMYDRWVQSVAHYPWGFRTLVTFAGAGGFRFPAVRIIGWLHCACEKVANREQLWREQRTGDATAELLAKLWTRAASHIRREPEALRQLAALCDDLARAGIALAAKLRAELV